MTEPTETTETTPNLAAIIGEPHRITHEVLEACALTVDAVADSIDAAAPRMFTSANIVSLLRSVSAEIRKDKTK